MTQHPLYFIKDLIENKNSMTQLRSDFYDEGVQYNRVFDIKTWSYEEEVMSPVDDQLQTVRTTFNDHLQQLLDKQSADASNIIDLDIIQTTNKEQLTHQLTIIQSTIKALFDLLEEREDLTIYPSIKETLLSIDRSLKLKYEDLLDNIVQSTPSIQWLGNANLLCTLFYDLWKGQEKEKKQRSTPLINAQKKDIEKLILTNFLDSKGQPFKASVLSDYLNESKDSTRTKMGKRIEIPL